MPEAKDSLEGKGFLMTYLHHINGVASKVLIIKVDGLHLELQAEIDLGVRVPLGFHCNWVSLCKK
mgnify:FL=1